MWSASRAPVDLSRILFPIVVGIINARMLGGLLIGTIVTGLFLAISITLSILILMTSLFIQAPLEFSAFPTILLISTMLRLSLNLASTRLILSRGHEGTDAAGFYYDYGSFEDVNVETAAHNAEINHLPLHRQVIPWAARKNVTAVHRADNQVMPYWVKMQ